MREIPGFPERGKAPSLEDVAAMAGVSAITVSRVINAKLNVRRDTRERVEAALAALNYAPDKVRRFAENKNIHVTLLHGGADFAWLGEFLAAGLDHAGRTNIQLGAKLYEEALTEPDGHLRVFSWDTDGILVPPPFSDAAALRAALDRSGLPVVAIGGPAAGPGLSVRIDSRQAAFDMTRHLGTLGHRRIGFITGDPALHDSAERLAGYRRALSDLGLADLPGLVAQGSGTYRSGLDAADRLLALAEPPSAIFAGNDEMAAAAVAVAHSRGLDVPGDLTICGFDDSPLARAIWPALTTVRQPVADMARLALDLLVDAIRLKTIGSTVSPGESHRLADYQLIRRQSDAAPRSRPAIQYDRVA